jgi:hypothetical protein
MIAPGLARSIADQRVPAPDPEILRRLEFQGLVETPQRRGLAIVSAREGRRCEERHVIFLHHVRTSGADRAQRRGVVRCDEQQPTRAK